MKRRARNARASGEHPCPPCIPRTPDRETPARVYPTGRGARDSAAWMIRAPGTALLQAGEPVGALVWTPTAGLRGGSPIERLLRAERSSAAAAR